MQNSGFTLTRGTNCVRSFGRICESVEYLVLMRGTVPTREKQLKQLILHISQADTAGLIAVTRASIPFVGCLPKWQRQTTPTKSRIVATVTVKCS